MYSESHAHNQCQYKNLHGHLQHSSLIAVDTEKMSRTLGQIVASMQDRFPFAFPLGDQEYALLDVVNQQCGLSLQTHQGNVPANRDDNAVDVVAAYLKSLDDVRVKDRAEREWQVRMQTSRAITPAELKSEVKRVRAQHRADKRKAAWAARRKTVADASSSVLAVVASALAYLWSFFHSIEKPFHERPFVVLWEYANFVAQNEEFRAFRWSDKVSKGRLIWRGLLTTPYGLMLSAKTVSIVVGTVFVLLGVLYVSSDDDPQFFARKMCVLDGGQDMRDCVVPMRALRPGDDAALRLTAYNPLLHTEIDLAARPRVRILPHRGGTAPVMLDELARTMVQDALTLGVQCLCAADYGVPTDLVVTMGPAGARAMQGACFDHVIDEHGTEGIDYAHPILGGRAFRVPRVGRVRWADADGAVHTSPNMLVDGLCVAKCADLAGRTIDETLCA